LVIVDDRIRWLSAISGEVIASVNQQYDRIESLALSADGLTLAVVGLGNDSLSHQISIFRQDATAKRVTPLGQGFGPGGTLRASALTPDGQRIAAGSGRIGGWFVFDTATGREIRIRTAGRLRKPALPSRPTEL